MPLTLQLILPFLISLAGIGVFHLAAAMRVRFSDASADPDEISSW